MTVSELIEKLQQLPQDMEVVRLDREDCWGSYYDSPDPAVSSLSLKEDGMKDYEEETGAKDYVVL